MTDQPSLTRRSARQGTFPIRAIALRPVGPADRDFLVALYATTRARELELTGLSDEQQRAFVVQQFEAQDHHYRTSYRGLAFDVVTVAGADAGRLSVSRTSEGIRVIDIALLPRYRGEGTGTALLTAILEEAAEARQRVTISVERVNPAQRVYQRLGFQQTAVDDVYISMEWTPRSVGQEFGGPDVNTAS